MTHEEFQDWFLYHLACFPEVRGWMKRSTPPGLADDKQPIRAWERVLSRFDKATAMQASDALLSGEIAAKGFGAHPTTIAEFCRKRIPSEQAGGQVYEGGEDCICDSNGFLTIVHEGHEYCVVCTCRRGNRRWGILQKHAVRGYRQFRDLDVPVEHVLLATDDDLSSAVARRDSGTETPFDREVIIEFERKRRNAERYAERIRLGGM